MTDPICQKRQLVKCPPFFKIYWAFVCLWLWKAATLSLQDLRMGHLPGNDDRTWPHRGPSKADEHTEDPWVCSYSWCPTDAAVCSQGTYFNSAINLPVIFNRANLPRSEFDFCISEGLVRTQSCPYIKPRSRRGVQGWGRHFPVVTHSGLCQDVFYRGQ